MLRHLIWITIIRNESRTTAATRTKQHQNNSLKIPKSENQSVRTHHSNLKRLQGELLHEALSHVVHDLVVHTFGSTTRHKKRGKQHQKSRRTENRKNSVGANRTGDGGDEVDGVGEAAEMRDGPIEGVLALRAVVDGDQDVAAPPSLSGLPVQLRLRYERRQHHFLPVVLFVLH